MKKYCILLGLLLVSLTLIMAQAVSDYTFSTVTTGSLEDMSIGTTNLLTGYSDAGASPVTNIGFAFTFAGTEYTQFSANANGLMRLGPTVISSTSVPISGQALLGPISGDNSIQASGKIHYKVVGSEPNRKLVIEWLNLRVNYSSSDTIGPFCTLQAWLYETSNRIDYVYGTMYNRSTSAQSRAAFISTSTTAGSIGCVATITTTPTWVVSGTSLTTTSFDASSYMTNLNSSENGSRRVFTFLPPDPFAVPNPAVINFPPNGGWAYTDASLSWTSGGGMPTSYDVYFGTSSTPSLVSDDQTGLTYTPALAAGTTYYWQVVPRNANGPAVDCPIWSFTTPRANQLAESFESTTFPPTSWSNPGGFTRSTTTPYHLTAGAYKSTASPAMLYTPMLELTDTSQLNFMARAGATTGIGRIQIKYSEDGSTWEAIGDPIAMPTNSNWNNYIVDLSSLAGSNYYIGFENYSSTTSAAAIYIDYVFGPDFAALTPDPATAIYPYDQGYTFTDGTLSWAAVTTGGIPTSYDVYFGTDVNPPFVVNQPGTAYTPALSAGTTYYWQIVPRNDTGSAEDCPVWSFSTPAATQLAESFDATAFPPIGWTNPGTWSRSTTTPFYGAGTAYKSASTTPAILSTPMLAIDADSELDFFYRTGSTTGYGLLNVKYSTDRVTWNQIGATISMPTTTEWRHANVALGAIPAGNYYLAFEVFTTSSTSSIYIDHVFGPDFAPVAPEPATPTAPANAAVNISRFPTFTWTAPTSGGMPTGYRIYCDTNTNPTTLLGTVSNGSTLSWTSNISLNYSTLYYWKVVAYNDYGNSVDSAIWSFTVMDDPTIYSFPWLEDFGTTGTTFPPTNWTRWSGVLADPSTLVTNSLWIQDNWLNDTTVTPVNYSARMNIYSTEKYAWIITPPIQMPGAGYQLEFDIGLTDFASTNPITSDPNGTTGVDDKFIVLIGNGSTWTPANVIRQWDNAGSPLIYNDIPNTGLHVTIPLDAYTGSYQVAFYGESTVSNADNDFFVDNVLVRQTPAGAPEHVTLATPADGATGVIPETLTLTWSPSLTGGEPAYYEIYVGEDPIDPSSSYYGEYFYESTTPNLDLSAQTDITLTYDSQWYWAVLPYNSEGQAPDPTAPEFMVWDFTIISDPTITSLPYAENFDNVVAPTLPYGWTTVVEASTTAAYVNNYNSSTYAFSPPNVARLYNSSDAAANLMLITPNITVPINTIKAKFYARGSTAGQVLLVGTINPTDSTFTQIGSIATTAAQVEYQVSFAAYAGTDTHIAFKHGLGATSRTIYLDNVQLLELQPTDLAATSISGPSLLNAGTSYDFTISVFNEGTATQNSYTVNLMSVEPRTLLATLNVSTPLDPEATAQHTLSWTPTTGGNYQIYGQVVIAGDGNAANDNSPQKEVNILDATMTVITVGDDATTTSANFLPLSMYFKNSVTEELYFTDEMHLQSGTIAALVYKNTFVSNLVDKQVKVWMAHTTVTDLTGGWLPAVDYTLVFDGVVDFPSGENYIVIPLDTPFAYTGGTLATRVNRPMDTAYFSSSDMFYYTTNPDHSTRSRYLRSDTTTYDPMAPSATGSTLNYFPNTMFIVQNAVMQTGAVLNGYVYESNGTTPIEGATVTLTDERYSTTTNAQGFYEFTFWENHTVDAVASKFAYYNHTVTGLALTMGNTVTQNFILGAMPRVNITGLVNANDAAFLAGAAVELNGIENHAVTTLADGTFSIPGVLGSDAGLAYTLTIGKEGYRSYIAPVTVYEAAINLGTITLIEYLWTGYNLVATHEGNNARLNWDAAGEPDYQFYDFEADNGGFTYVNSGTPGWEYGTSTYAGAHSGTKIWATGLDTNYGNNATYELISPLSIPIDNGAFLTFWHRYHFEGTTTFYDGGIVQVSSDGGTTWTTITPIGGYPVISVAALGSIPIYGGQQLTWTQASFDLSAFAGATLQFKWKFMSETSLNYPGWFIDDVFIGIPSRNIATLGTRNNERSFEDYTLYRMALADEAIPANWTMIQDNISALTYLDTGFASLGNGKYKWALKANYTGNNESETILSNHLGIVAMPQDIAATTVGTTVQLSWTADPGADYYVIYSSDNPYGTFTIEGYSATATYTISSPAARKFYKVAAADGEMPVAPPAKLMMK